MHATMACASNGDAVLRHACALPRKFDATMSNRAMGLEEIDLHPDHNRAAECATNCARDSDIGTRLPHATPQLRLGCMRCTCC